MTDTLFGYLVNRFSSSPENLATESLCFILNKSNAAREAFLDFLSQITTPLPAQIRFETQFFSEQDASIPDLVGLQPNGRALILGEAKFWAGLTGNQPVTYLNRLEQEHGSLLVFFAPEKRFPTLWPELLRRCNNAGIPSTPQKDNANLKVNALSDSRFMVLASWKVILNAIRAALETNVEKDMLGNLVQLEGLCDYMDITAFLPLRSEELNPAIGTRSIQYCDIVDAIVETLAAEQVISTTGLHATGLREGHRRYFKNNTNACSLEVNFQFWSQYRATPIWLGIWAKDWKSDPDAQIKLASLKSEQPTRLFQIGKVLYIPIFLEMNQEKDAVITAVMRQVREVFDLLSD